MPGMLSTLSAMGNEYFVSKKAKWALCPAHFRGDEELARGTEAIDTLRELIADTTARHPNVKIGLTGLPIMENDEMRASQSSMFWGGMLSFIGVVIVVIAGFGGVRHALIGQSRAADRHRLGIRLRHAGGGALEYSEHHVHRHAGRRRNRLRHVLCFALHAIAPRGAACEESLDCDHEDCRPGNYYRRHDDRGGVLRDRNHDFHRDCGTGHYRRRRDFALRLAQLFVLPALVRVVDESSLGQASQTGAGSYRNCFADESAAADDGIVVVMHGRRRLRPHTVWYDYNLLNMEPEGLESVNLEHRLLTECDQSMWYALSIADTRERVAGEKSQVHKLPSVERTEEIASICRSTMTGRNARSSQISQSLATLPERPPLIAVDSIGRTRRRFWLKRKISRAHDPRWSRLRPSSGTTSQSCVACQRRIATPNFRSFSSKWPASCSAGCTCCAAWPIPSRRN